MVEDALPGEARPAGEPPTLASLLRRAVLRGLLVGLAFALLFTWLVFLNTSGKVGERLVAVECGFLLGAFSGPLLLVERWFGRRRPSVARDLLAGALVGALATGLFFLASVQAAYAYGVLARGSFSGGVDEMRSFTREVLHNARPFAHLFIVPAAPLVPLTIVRLRGLGTAKQVATTFALGGLLALPSAIVVYDESHGIVAMWFPAALCLYLILLPLALRGADLLEDRFFERS